VKLNEVDILILSAALLYITLRSGGDDGGRKRWLNDRIPSPRPRAGKLLPIVDPGILKEAEKHCITHFAELPVNPQKEIQPKRKKAEPVC
jgi:hypothetical protein